MSAIKELAKEIFESSEEWLKEGQFNDHAEMIYAQNIQELNNWYKTIKSEWNKENKDE